MINLLPVQGRRFETCQEITVSSVVYAFPESQPQELTIVYYIAYLRK